ncbi:hypothetical protein P3S67_027426 [Capsicum chacoense]
MGNIIHMAEANWEVSEGPLDYKLIVKKIQNSIKNVTKHGYDVKNMENFNMVESQPTKVERGSFLF